MYRSIYNQALIKKIALRIYKQKIFFTRETIRGIRISQNSLKAEIPLFSYDWLRSLN